MAFCPSCGAGNAESVKFCASCGKPMPVAAMPTQEPVQAPAPAYPPPQYPPPAYPQPPYPQQQYAPPGYPQYPPYAQPYGYPAVQAPPQKTAMPTAAGILLIIAGVLGLIDWGIVLAFGTLAAFIPFLGAIILICGIIGITFSVFALLGGIMAVQRKMWGLALTGSILGLFTVGFVGEASLLSLIALILIAVSHREFT